MIYRYIIHSAGEEELHDRFIEAPTTLRSGNQQNASSSANPPKRKIALHPADLRPGNSAKAD